MGLSSQALEHARNIIQQNASLPMAQYNLGWFQTLNNDYIGAEKSFNAAVNLYARYTKAQHASTLNKIAGGITLSKTDLGTLSKAEKSTYSSISKTGITAPVATNITPASTNIAPVSTNPAQTSAKTTIARPKFVAAWWWWVLMVSAIFVLVILFGRAANNDKNGAAVWGFLSTIAVIIAVIVFAIWFRSNSTFSTVLWCFVILDIIIMIPSSSS
jgi:hypothetical protein